MVLVRGLLLVKKCFISPNIVSEADMKANVVIDIEMCTVQKEYQWKDYPYEHEIIPAVE